MSLRRVQPRYVDWRLSRIDEELDRVSCNSTPSVDEPLTAACGPVPDGGSMTPPPPSPLPPPPPIDDDDELMLMLGDGTGPIGGRLGGGKSPSPLPDLPPPPAPSNVIAADDAPIYSNVSGPGGVEPPRDTPRSDDEKEALRFIKEKYDSLGKVKVEKPTSSTPGGTVVVEEVVTSVPDVPRTRPGAVSTARDLFLMQGGEVVVGSPKPGMMMAAEKSSVQAHRCCCAHQQARQQQQQQQPVSSPQPCHHHHHHGGRLPGGPLTDHELIQVEMFYRSHKTSVHVSACAASLSFCSTSGAESQVVGGGWTLAKTGVPVLIADSGDGRRRRRVYVVLAERGTGFELWRVALDRATDYVQLAAGVHTIRLTPSPAADAAADKQRQPAAAVARLVFDETAAAEEFHRQLGLQFVAADVADPGTGRRKTKKKDDSAPSKKIGRSKSARLPVSKADISQPCCFSHVTRLERDLGAKTVHVATDRPGEAEATPADKGAMSPSVNCKLGRAYHSFRVGH